MKSRIRQWFSLVVLILFVLAGIFLVPRLQSIPVLVHAGQAIRIPVIQNLNPKLSAEQIATQPVVQAVPIPTPYAGETSGIISPLPSPPPFPTPLPTPVATRVPVTKLPAIPDLLEGSGQPYTIYTSDGDTIQAIDSVDGTVRNVVDIYQQTSLHLGRREAHIRQWGSLSPDGKRWALVLTNYTTPEELGKVGSPNYTPAMHSIYLLDASSGETRPVVDNALRPVWSPDGTRIAFRNRGTQGLAMVDIATGAITELFAVEADSGHMVDWFDWSPDGKQIAVVEAYDGFANVGSIWVVEAAKDSAARRFTEMEMNAAALQWSPSGDQLLFVSGRGERQTVEPPNNLWKLDIETGTLQQLTFNMGVRNYDWSPDGEWIAFAGVNLLEGEDYQHDIWLLSHDGSSLRRLTDDPVADVDLQWAPDGKRLVVDRDEPGLLEVDLRDGASRQFTSPITSTWLLE